MFDSQMWDMFGETGPCKCGNFVPSYPKYQSKPVDMVFLCRNCIGSIKLSELIEMKEKVDARKMG